jgi:D-aminopeptidase
VHVLIAADMEGVAGIEHYGECLPSHRSAYARGRRLMTDEVLASIDALRSHGVERITVGDWHMVGTNVERERLPDGVEVRPIAGLALEEARPSFAKAAGGPLDAVVLSGHHASSSSPRGFCSHTFVWEMEVELDGAPLSEVQVYAQALAAEGLPALLVSGDSRMLEELGEGELGSARLTPAKEGLGRPTARCAASDGVHEEIAAAIGAAIEAQRRPPPARTYPAQLRVAVGGKEIARTEVADPGDLLTAVATAFRGSRVSREYRQLARILPAEQGSRARSARRRLGSLIATPAIRAKERSWLGSARRE